MGLTVKIIWTEEKVKFITDSFGKLTAREMPAHLNISMDSVRVKYRKLGLFAMTMEYWTDEQITFLSKNFKSIGDLELAEEFQKTWPKQKKWTKKHIEKKRNYLNFHRTKDELKVIHQRNVDQGRFTLCNRNRWLAQGVAVEGEIRMWRQNNGKPIPFVKVDGRFIHWNRWFWEQNYGPIPEGMYIVFIGSTFIHNIENLKMITKEEFELTFNKKNVVDLSTNFVLGKMTQGDQIARDIIRENFPELIELKKQQLKLNRTIRHEKI